MTQETYPQPADGWVCFHCGERFTTPGSAEDHFGARPEEPAACLIKYGNERGLVMELRKAQAQADSLIEIIRGLQRAPGCYCEAGIGNPMVTNHTEACRAARLALSERRPGDASPHRMKG